MKKTLAVALSLSFVALGVQAQSSDTLKKIKDSGSVTMGVRESSGALSFTLGDGKFAGYHIEICEKVIADVRRSSA
jgi:glutamate/aspartate transport system substrate-binding protein